MISSVSRSRSGWMRATWSFVQMTLPRAESFSSMRWILTVSGRLLRRCCSSWSVVDVGTRRPFRLLIFHLISYLFSLDFHLNFVQKLTQLLSDRLSLCPLLWHDRLV